MVAQPDAELTDTEVMNFVAEHVAPYKKVRQVEFIDAVPKSASGKILRKDLRAREASRSPDVCPSERRCQQCRTGASALAASRT